MTDFSQPTSPMPEKADATSASLPQDSPVPAAVPVGGAAFAGVAALAALASLALIFLLPRVGGRVTAWRRSIAGLRLLAPARERSSMLDSIAYAPIKRPRLALLGSEPWRAAREYVAHKVAPEVRRAPGDGHPVILFPGLGIRGGALAPLCERCRLLGYNAVDWGRGYNSGPQGDLYTWLLALAAHVDRLLAPLKQSATLIGCSLGGLYARELAKLRPRRVRQVITFGTPINAMADHTHVGWVFRLLSGTGLQFNPALSERLRTPPPLPTTSIYSRADGIVAWQTCLHADPAPQVEDVEIDGSYTGMGWNPALLAVVADRLAQPVGRWRPYVPQ